MFALALLAVCSGLNYQLDRLLREIRGEQRWGRSSVNNRGRNAWDWRNARNGDSAESLGLLKFVSDDDTQWKVVWAEDECVVADPVADDGMERLDEACAEVEGNGIRFKNVVLGEGSTAVAERFNNFVEGRAFATEFAQPAKVDQPIYSLEEDLPSTQNDAGNGVGPDTMLMYACGTLSLNKGDDPSTQIWLEDICIGVDAYFKKRLNVAGIWDEDKRSGFNQYFFLGWSGGGVQGGNAENDDDTIWRKMDDTQIHTEFFTKKCVTEYKYMSADAPKVSWASTVSGMSASTSPASVACNAKWSNGHSLGNGKGLGSVLDVEDANQYDSRVRLGAMKAKDMSAAPWTCTMGKSPVDCFDCDGRPMCPAPSVPVPGKFEQASSSRYKTNEIFVQVL